MNPTLSMSKAIAASGLSDEQLQELQGNFINMFFHPDAKLPSMKFTAESIEHIATGATLTDFAAGVSGRYKVDGVAFLVLTTGDVVELRFV